MPRYIKTTMYLLFLIFGICLYVRAEEVAKITSVHGRVDVLYRGKIPAVRAKVNMSLNQGDVVRTRSRSTAEITFVDGSVVQIAPRTRMDIRYYRTGEKALIKLPRGKISLKVKKIWGEKGRKFEVKTPIAVAGVRGTHFIVIHRGFITSVAVIGGKVYTYNIRFPNRVIVVKKGQITVISFNQPPSSPREFSPEEEKGFKRGFTLKDKTKEKNTSQYSFNPSEDLTILPITENENVSEEIGPTISWSKTLEGKIHYYDSSSSPYIKQSSSRVYITFSSATPIPYPDAQNRFTSKSVDISAGYDSSGIWWGGPEPDDVAQDGSKFWAVFAGYIPEPSENSLPIIFGRGIYFKDNRTGLLKLENNDLTMNTSSKTFSGTATGRLAFKMENPLISTSLYQEKVPIEGWGMGFVGDSPIYIDYGSFGWGSMQSYTLRPKIGTRVEPWGIFWITAGGRWSTSSSADSFRMDLSGTNFTTRSTDNIPEFWVIRSTGNWSDYSSPFNGYYLTGLRFGQLEGIFVKKDPPAVYGGDNSWLGMFIGSFSSTELQHASYIFTANTPTTSFYGLLGGPSTSNIWEDGASLIMAGEFDQSLDPHTWCASISSWNYITDEALTYDLGAYEGYLVGRRGTPITRGTANFNVDARMALVFVDPSGRAGIIKGHLGDSGIINNVYHNHFFAQGSTTAVVPLMSGVSVGELTSYLLFDNLVDVQEQTGGFINDPSSNISLSSPPEAEFTYYMRSDWSTPSWGVGYLWFSTGTETYYGTPGEWIISFSTDISSAGGTTGAISALLKGDTWGNENVSGDTLINSISGNIYGAYLDGNNTVGVFVGETIGVFNPTDFTWEAIAPIVWMETSSFLEKACPGGTCNTSGSSFTQDQEKLRRLGFPVVEVGRASFSGSTSSFSVDMNDVIFFATQSGAKPYIWATSNVGGSFWATVNLEDTATLNCTSGCSGSLDFIIKNWYSSTWSAKITGSGTLSGGSYTGAVTMQGIAAGNKDSGASGTFSGKASGFVK